MRWAEADQLQHLLDLLLTLILVTDPVEAETLGDGRADLGPGIERPVGVLEDDLHSTAKRLQVVPR
jgi:hypothetical protein